MGPEMLGGVGLRVRKSIGKSWLENSACFSRDRGPFVAEHHQSEPQCNIDIISARRTLGA